MDRIEISNNSPQNGIPSTNQSPKIHERRVLQVATTPRSNPKPPNKRNSGASFLGVRQRPSGRWVAEIKHSSKKLRFWLGTFDRAEEAAMAYDSAAMLLRGRNAKTNFPFKQTNNTHELKSTLLAKNSKLHNLLHQEISKNHAKSSLINAHGARNYQKRTTEAGLVDYGSHAEETILSSPPYGGLSLGGIKVYSSVHVAPSFSGSFNEQEKNCEEIQQSHKDLFLDSNGLLDHGFV